MKKTLFILITLVALAGCQTPEGQQQQGQPDMDQRKEIAHKLIVKSLNDLQNKDLKSTIIDLETSIKISPTEPEAYMLLGQILLKIQEYDHAADFLDMAGKQFPDNGTVFYMLSIANRMSGKKLPAVLAARHSVEVFQAQQDRDNMLKSAALLHELIDTPDNQFVPANKQGAPQAPTQDQAQPQAAAPQASGND
jgi:outer membrane protein assembly factor BamD (BamD/ComL family)